jgi:hypothetical protein
MHSRFDRFRATPIGKQLEALIDLPERYPEYAALSRVGMAAIAAVADEIAGKYPEIETDTTARQFCGAMVADVMRRHGHELVQARGRVGGRLFSYGAVFSARPVVLPFPRVIEALAAMPGRLAEHAAHIPRAQWTRRPDGTGFSFVEHVCHLRDFDAVSAQRIEAIRRERLPVIAAVDGLAVAQARRYLDQSPGEAFEAFRQARRRLCLSLRRLGAAQLERCGLHGGIRRVSLEELVRELLDHDRTHCLELDELREELRDALGADHAASLHPHSPARRSA